MLYFDFHGESLSRLGFGTMRLPLDPDGTIDNKQMLEMVDYAIENGVNYFDTALPYHGGKSEIAIGEALKRYSRDRFYFATKYPGHRIAEGYQPASTFELQLQKCGVDFFDFYLFHNVNDTSLKLYMDPQFGMLDYFLDQKRRGRIRYFGFSCHARTENLERFLDYCGDQIDFCQIEINYLDWTLQDAKGKYELLTQRGIPVWVMEPLRGGKLAKLGEENENRLKALRPDESIPAWGFRYLMGLPNIKMILSGMSSMEQMVDNIKTFETDRPLSSMERETLLDIAETMKSGVPCTKCRYCCDGCPMKLDIPTLLQIYNDLCFAPTVTIGMQMKSFDQDKLPSACICCGQCTAACPQQIDVPAAMKKFVAAMQNLPSPTKVTKP